MGLQVHCGDVLAELAKMESNSADAVFSDPPYGLGKTPDMADLLHHWLNDKDYQFGKGFMGKDWDIVPGPAVWRELYRVAKPGAYLFAFGGTRTADLLSIAIRLAGWERFDEIAYYHSPDLVYGSGFPKSAAIDKLIDAKMGKSDDREVIGTNPYYCEGRTADPGEFRQGGKNGSPFITSPATPEAATWAGYGTALKPAREPILCFRKPVDGTYAANALAWNCGGLAIDACRVSAADFSPKERIGAAKLMEDRPWQARQMEEGRPTIIEGNSLGRWPANVIHDGSPAVMAEFDKAGETVSKSAYRGAGINGNMFKAPECASTVRGHTDTGTAARFFAVCPPDNPPFVYSAKASRGERNAGLDDANHHPCVKPLSLCKYLASMILPPEAYRDTATILIPYAGSGSEMVGAMQAGWQNIIGIEKDVEYIEIAKKRFAYWLEKRKREVETTQHSLF